MMDSKPNRIDHNTAIELERQLNKLIENNGFISADILESQARRYIAATLFSTLFDNQEKSANAYWAMHFFLAESDEVPELVDQFLKSC